MVKQASPSKKWMKERITLLFQTASFIEWKNDIVRWAIKISFSYSFDLMSQAGGSKNRYRYNSISRMTHMHLNEAWRSRYKIRHLKCLRLTPRCIPLHISQPSTWWLNEFPEFAVISCQFNRSAMISISVELSFIILFLLFCSDFHSW